MIGLHVRAESTDRAGIHECIGFHRQVTKHFTAGDNIPSRNGRVAADGHPWVDHNLSAIDDGIGSDIPVYVNITPRGYDFTANIIVDDNPAARSNHVAFHRSINGNRPSCRGEAVNRCVHIDGSPGSKHVVGYRVYNTYITPGKRCKGPYPGWNQQEKNDQNTGFHQVTMSMMFHTHSQRNYQIKRLCSDPVRVKNIEDVFYPHPHDTRKSGGVNRLSQLEGEVYVGTLNVLIAPVEGAGERKEL